MNNHIVCRYMKSLGMDPIKVNVLVDKDYPWSPLMGWGMKHQRARNGQFDKRWQPVEKTKDYQLLEGAWGEASSSRIARSYRGIATQWNDGRPIHSARLLVCLSHRPAKLPIGRPVWDIFQSWKILADIVRRDIFLNIFQRWKILADIVRRRQSTPLSWGLVCKPQDWNATQLLLRQ